MSKALVLSLLLLAVALAAGEAAPAVPNPAAAKSASDALQTRDETVKAADAKAAAVLKKLMTKYKKDAPTLTMLAVKLHKLDPNDADAIAALKDVPPDQQDLLGDAAQPGKYLTDVQAKVIADALAKGKFTAKDWEALPGKEIEVKMSKQVEFSTANGIFIIVPNPADKWQGNKDVKKVGYNGEGDTRFCITAWLEPNGEGQTVKRHIIESPIISVKDAKALVGNGEKGWTGTGSIRVKIFEVVPVGE